MPQMTPKKRIITGAENFEEYLPLLKEKKVGVVTNQTGIVSYVTEFKSPSNPGEFHLTHRADTASVVAAEASAETLCSNSLFR